ISLCINFGILFTFKYFNFINESIYYFLENLGLRWTIPNLDILLPVGISFYTFQAVSYTIEIYQGTIKTERNLGIYALFVSFFPQLVAGPIERAQNLLPQFRKKHNLNISNISSGFKQMLWGYFMKVVIADRVAIYVNSVYNNVDSHNGTTFIIATVFFAIQIYCDFAGYSNIAIGAARIMGFNLMENFNRPYFA
ncbi:MAG: MBOAT family protein, partial [Ignavibacteriae bacterium]|nr:MBOAT family protein [Ignavibacteriota bacterium]